MCKHDLRKQSYFLTFVLKAVTLGMLVFLVGVLSTNVVHAKPELDANGNFTITFINGDNIWRQSEVKPGQQVKAPENPPLTNGQLAFAGWYSQPTGGTQFNFKETIDRSQALFAHFSYKYLIQFKDTGGKVVDSEEVLPGNPIPESTVSNKLIPPANTHFDYWYEQGDSQKKPFDFTNSKATKNVVLLPKFSNTRTVLFISDGTQVDPEYVEDGKAATKPTDPTRQGYTFSHWSTTKNGSQAYNFDSKITQNLKLYAVWAPKEVNYTVVYWLEKPNISGDPGDPNSNNDNRKNYNYAWSTQQQALSGSTQTVTAANANSWKDADATGKAALNFSHFGSADTSTISGSGTSIINVYYKQNIYTIGIDLNDPDHNTTLTINGKTYRGDGPKYSFTAKNGQNISNLWPLDVKSGTADTYEIWWKPSVPVNDTANRVSNPIIWNSEMLPTDPSILKYDFSAQWARDANPFTLKYYKQNISGTNYIEDPEYTQTVRYPSSNWKAKAIPGFTPSETKSNGNNYDFYYTRNSYKLILNPSGGKFANGDGTSTVKYQQAVTEPTSPTRSGYTFAGWYMDSKYHQKADFNTLKMPASDLTLFAKWESTQNKVTYYDSQGGHKLLQQGYADNDTVDFPANYVKEQTYVPGKGLFGGWFWQVGNTTEEFSQTIPVIHDIDLFAKWITNGFKLTYDKGAGTGTAPIDNQSYANTKKASLKDGTGLVAPNHEVFIGWTSNKDEKIHYPNENMAVNGDTKLTAFYTDPENVIHIRYHPNYDNHSEVVTQNVLKNSTFALLGSLFKRQGKVLTGWATSPAGKVTYKLDDPTFKIGDHDIDLYAVWEPLKLDILFVPGDHGTLDYHNKSLFTVDYGTSWENSGVTTPTPIPDQDYEFAGWEPSLPNNNDVSTANKTYTATFKRVGNPTPVPPKPTPNPTPKPTPKPEPTQKQPSLVAKKSEAVYSLKKIYLYANKTFKKSQRIAAYSKKPRINRPMFVVTDYARSKHGALRYKVRDVNHHSKTDGKRGFITANTQFVRPVYYHSQHKVLTVINPRGVNEYGHKNLTRKIKNFKQGTMLKVKGFIKYHLTTRYLLTNGHFVTGNRKLVISGRHKQPKLIKVRKTIYRYNNPNFSHRLNKIKRGITLKIKRWQYSHSNSLSTYGTKRYAVAGGFVSANPKFVKVIK